MQNTTLALSGLRWSGRGVPELKSLVWRRGRRALQLAWEGRVRTVLHLGVATVADLWNFHIWPVEGAAECPCCGWRGASFLAAWDWRAPTFQSRCPQCDSRSRHRGLEPILPEVLRRKPEGPILVFAPEPITADQLRRLAPGDRVLTAGGKRTAVAVDYPGEDIQKLSLPDASFAVVICNHALAVAPDDQRAVRECARVLQPGGIAVFTAPGNFRREFSWYFPETDDGKGFRRYGMDLMSRLQAAFRRVEAVDLGRTAERPWRVRPGDYAFLCLR